MESRERIFLCGRWFFLIKETEDKLTYSTSHKNQSNNMLLEEEQNVLEKHMLLQVNKETLELNILCFEDDKMITKITINDLDKNTVLFHYKEKEPQLIKINNNIYANLILEANLAYKDLRSLDDIEIIVSRKRIMKKMCYLTPDFPTDKVLTPKDIEVESDYFTFLKNLSEFIYVKKNRIIQLLDNKNDFTCKETTIPNKIKKLKIEENIFFYNRNYTLVNQDKDTLYYKNNDDEETDLLVRFNAIYNNITDLYLSYKDKMNYKLHVNKNSEGRFMIRFGNYENEQFNLSDNRQYDDFLYQAELIIDNEDHIQSFITKMSEKNRQYILMPVPNFSNTYVDELGVEHRIVNRNFCRLLGMAKFSGRAFTHVEKVLTKVD